MKSQAAGATVGQAELPGRRPAALQGMAGWIFDAVHMLMKRGWTDGRRRRLPQLRVVETLQLGSRRQLLLISCRGERFLVGTGAETVQTIVRVRAESCDEDARADNRSAADAAEVTW
jgi:flagellar biogenesis protein FliO